MAWPVGAHGPKHGANGQPPDCGLVFGSPAMSLADVAYHREREQHCRRMAQVAADAEIRHRHEELADLHASKAAQLLVRHD